MTKIELSKRYSRIDNLRSIYLSEKYKNIPSLVDMQETATAMGHQITTALTDYRLKSFREYLLESSIFVIETCPFL